MDEENLEVDVEPDHVGEEAVRLATDDAIFEGFVEENQANSAALFDAFTTAKTLMTGAFDGVSITYKVLGSARNGTGLQGVVDIDVDMIFSEPWGAESHGGLNQHEFVVWVNSVVDVVEFRGIRVREAGVDITRSFKLVVRDFEVELFPKYRSRTNRTSVQSFGGQIGAGTRFARGYELAEDYEQPVFATSEPNRLAHAILVLKHWKLSNALNIKSYHFLVLSRCAMVGDHLDLPDDYFAFPPRDNNTTISDYIVALYRRIVAVRCGNAKICCDGQQISHIDYGGNNLLTEDPPLLDNFDHLEDRLLGGVDFEVLRNNSSNIEFRCENTDFLIN